MTTFKLEDVFHRADEIQSICTSGEGFYIYGASQLGIEVFDFLTEGMQLNIKGFLDKNPDLIGTLRKGVHVHDPDDFADKGAKIIVASVLTHEICPWLHSNGFETWVIYRGLYFLSEKYRDMVRQLYSKMEDEESRQTLVSLLAYYLGLSPKPPMSKYEQYIHPAMQLEDTSAIVDGGSFDGDTIRLFRQHYGEKVQIYAFEPIESNFKNLIENHSQDSLVKCINAGLWSEAGRKYFRDGGLYASTIIEEPDNVSEQGAFILDVAMIDQVLEGGPVDLIKMDIEGAEHPALIGARETILRHSPNLAISLYHKPDDWLLIPQFLFEILPDHKFYLGHHSANFFETVLYAIRP